MKPPKTKAGKTHAEEASWEGVDRDLFEHIRGVRREVAKERSVPAYVIFGDRTLREMARLRPGSLDALRCVTGVGDRKLADFGVLFTGEISAYCEAHSVEMEPAGFGTRSDDPVPVADKTLSGARQVAFEMFAQGRSVIDVASSVQRAPSTALQYLVEYIRAEQPKSIEAWVDQGTYHTVAEAADEVGTRRLRPIFERLGESVPYDTIRLVARHLEVRM